MSDFRPPEKQEAESQQDRQEGKQAGQAILSRVGRRLLGHSRTERALVVIGTFALTALLDFLLDPSLSLFALYLVPTIYSAWFLGPKVGYITWERFSDPAAVICESIRARLNAFIGDQPQFDDISLLVLKVRSEPAEDQPAAR